MTAVFSAAWLCRLCGREACAECFGTMRALTEPRPGAPDAELATQQARREAHAHANPFFLACTRRAEHSARDFSPASRFHAKELADVIAAMERLLRADGEQSEGRAPATPVDGVCASAPARRLSMGQLMSSGGAQAPVETPANSTEGAGGRARGGSVASQTKVMSGGGSPDSAQTPPAHVDVALSQAELIHGGGHACSPAQVLTTPDDDAMTVSSVLSSTATLCGSPPPTDAAAPLAMHPMGPLDAVPSHPTTSVPAGTLSEDAFRALLAAGQPVVVTGLAARFEDFTPAWFAARAGGVSCAVVDTQTEAARKVPVGAFFAAFGTPAAEHARAHGEKLKDWPPPGGFRAALPELWDALQRDLPFGAFCRRDGVCNLASHFPGNVPAPELGACLVPGALRGVWRCGVGQRTCVLYAPAAARATDI
jgi:lysine-specific demethylase 3